MKAAMRGWRSRAAACRIALLLVAGAAACGAPAAQAAADAAGDFDALLAELERLPRETFERDPQQWQAVFDLLEQYAATLRPAARPGLLPGAAAGPDAALVDRFAAVFRQLAAAVRDVRANDLASRMLHSGLNGTIGASVGGTGRAAGPALDEVARRTGFAFPSAQELALLMRRIEAANARLPNAQSLNQGMRDALGQLKSRASRHSQDLVALQRAGQALSQRLALLDALVQRSAALASGLPEAGDPAADADRLAQLRAEYAALRALQDDELVKLGAQDATGASRSLPDVAGAGGVPISRAAVAKAIAQRIEILHGQQDDPVHVGVRIGQCELYLAALDALAREELIKAAALRQGERAQDQLAQVGAETQRLAGAVDRASAR